MKNYIGLGTSPHDPSLAIVDKNGELVYAEASERPLQSKRAHGNVPDHIGYIERLIEKYCDPEIDTVVGLTWSEDLAQRYDKSIPEIDGYISKSAQNNRKGLLTHKYFQHSHRSVLSLASTGIEYALGNKNSAVEQKFYDHHLTHAATASFASPYTNAICAVIDGFGEGSSIAAFHYQDGKLTQIEEVKSIKASLGSFYSSMCDICGFSPVHGEEWKLMGLAAYGKLDQKIYDLIRPLLVVNGLQLERGENSTEIYDSLEEISRKPEVPAIEFADFAATAQIVFTETVIEFLNNLHQLDISDNLILSGGCALNSSANGKIIRNTPFKELFVNSAPADDGNAIGAAYLAYYADNPDAKVKAGIQSPYLGSEMLDLSLSRLKEYGGFRFEQLAEEELCIKVAEALSEGNIVGWVQGKAEFGPRALGNRSILADPRHKRVKDRINAEVKFREEFRPFAPSILHEFGESYFENYQFTPYMERTLSFKDSVKDKVAGVYHEDGTGRLQSVTKELNSRYYQLISAFNEITGVPIVLNTSFNVMGKPIVHSVEDAVAVLQTSGIDIMVIDNTIFYKDQAQTPIKIELREEAALV